MKKKAFQDEKLTVEEMDGTLVKNDLY